MTNDTPQKSSLKAELTLFTVPFFILLFAFVLLLDTAEALEGEDVRGQKLQFVDVTLHVVAGDITCHLKRRLIRRV
jgi:hypothetical protein